MSLYMESVLSLSSAVRRDHALWDIM